MSAREEERGPQAEPRTAALALLRGRFGAAWMPSIVFDDVLAGVRLGWRCDMHHIATGATFQGTYNGESELAAARACIAAWDEATKDERTRVVSAARGIALDAVDDMAAAGHRAVDIAVAALAAERALSDRLAEALRDYYNGLPSHGATEALAAHAERRKA